MCVYVCVYVYICMYLFIFVALDDIVVSKYSLSGDNARCQRW